MVVADVIVVSGPGAGKSTVAALLASGFSPSALVEGDRFFGFLREGFVEPWLAEAHAQNLLVVAAAAAATGRLARGEHTVVYDGVVGPWFIDDFAGACEVDRLHYVVLLPPEPVALDRCAPIQARLHRPGGCAPPAPRLPRGRGRAPALVTSGHTGGGRGRHPSTVGGRRLLGDRPRLTRLGRSRSRDTLMPA